MPDDGHLNPREVFAGDDTPSGTTAFLQALMSMLGEVLDRVDGRLASLERTLAAREDPPLVIRPDAGDEKVSAALERISERLERLEAREPEGITTEAAMTRLADLSGSVDDVGRRLARLADVVTASSEAEGEWPEGLRASLAALGEDVAELRHVVPVQAVTDVGRVVTRLEGQLDGMRAQLTAQGSESDAERAQEMTNVVAALERIFERLERMEARPPEGITTEAAMEAAMTRLGDLSASVDDVGRRLAGLADIVTASSEAEQEWPQGLRASLATLGEGLAGVRAQVAAQGADGAEERNRQSVVVVAALERVSERLERLEAREPEGITTEAAMEAAMTRLADLSGSVDDVGRRLARLADVVTASSEAEEEWPEGLRASLATLGEGLVGTRTQLATQGTESAREMTNVVAALERVSERLECLEAREPKGITTEVAMEAAMTRLADLSGSVDDVGRRLAGLADIVTAPSEAEEEWADGLQASMTALGEGLAGLRSQLAAQGSENAGQHNREMTSVLAALERLGHRLEQLEERDPAKPGLEEAVSRLDDLSTAVDSIGYGMAGIADLVTAPSAPSEGRLELPEGLWAALLALGEGVVELRQDLNVQPVAELRGTVRRLEGQLTLLDKLLASQPGPGAAVAMVAAGLAERFEERTEALTELLGTHAAYVRQTWERIEGILDGGGFDELAVGDALEHVIRNQELMADSVERVIVRIEDLHALPQATGDGLAREALETLGAGMEGVGVRVDDVRRRLAALARALEASSHEVAPDPDASDPATVIGRRATTAGRRLANDLGLRGRGRSPRPPGGDQSPPRR